MQKILGLLLCLLTSQAMAQVDIAQFRQSEWGGWDGQPVVTDGGKVIAGPNSKPVLLQTTSQLRLTLGKPYKWIVVSAERVPYLDIVVDLVPVDSEKTIWTFPELTATGKYRVVAEGYVEGGGPPDRSRVIVDVVGPGPGPQPEPPPEPQPGPAPIPVDGLHVLIVYEQDDQASYLSSQRQQLGAAAFRTWLSQTTKRSGADVGYRILDQDAVDPPGKTSIWTTALKRKRDSMPWIIVSNGKAGYEGPLPVTEQETRELIEKFK